MKRLILGVTLVYILGMSHGLNNKRQKPTNKACTVLGSVVNCNSYAKCVFKSHCRSNPDVSWNRFKLLIMQPLSERLEEEPILEDYGDEESEVVAEESARILNSATERHYRMIAASVAAVNHINERNGAVVKEVESMRCRFKFNYSIIDTQSNPSRAIDDFTSGLLQQGTPGEYDYVLGAGEDEITTSVSILSRLHNIPMISSSSSDIQLDDKTVHPYFSRASPSHAAIVEAVAAYLGQMNFGQAALIYIEGPGTVLKDNLVYQGSQEGVTLEPFPLSGDIDERLNQTLDAIVESTLNIIVAIIPFDLFEPVLSRASDRDLVREGRLWLFTDTYDENQLNSAARMHPHFASLMNGTLRVITNTGTSISEGFARFKESWPSFEAYRSEINSQLPGGPGAPPFVASDDLNFELPQNLFNSKHLLTPKEAFAYDAAIAAAFALCAADAAKHDLRISKDGRAERIHDLIKDVQFEGASGDFRLLPRTASRDPSTLSYALQNHIFYVNQNQEATVTNVVVGSWTTQNRTWQVDADRIVYPGNTRRLPLVTDNILIDENQTFVEARMFVFFFAGVTYLMVVAFFGWVVVNYKKPVVRASQPFFLSLVLLGVFTSNTAVFFLSDHLYYASGKEFIYSCQLAFWFWSVGTTIATSALLVKTYRIFKLFINPKLREIKILFKDLIAAIVLFVSIDVAILSLWTAISPWVFTEVEVGPFDDFGRPSETYAVCRGAQGYRTEIPFVVVLFLFHFAIYMIAGFLAWKSRHVSTDFQEGKWIGLSLASQLQVLAFAIPSVAATQGSNTTVPFVVLSIAVMTINLVLLLVLFLPKIFRLRYGLQEVRIDNSMPSSDNEDGLKSYRSYRSGPGHSSPLLHGNTSRKEQVESPADAIEPVLEEAKLNMEETGDEAADEVVASDGKRRGGARILALT